MAKRKGRKSKNSLIGAAVTLVILLLTFFFGESDPGKTTNRYLGDGEAYIHIIDVGQGSATLIQNGNKGILIDTGENDYGDYLVSYINSCGVDELEYVIASHPHSDHIGAVVDVFNSFEVGAVVMPELSEKNIPTTRVYENMMNYIFDNNLEVIFPEFGDVIHMDSVSVSFYGPVEQNEDLNNMSLICKINALGTDIMVLGDAEKEELSSVFPQMSTKCKSDILVMGHHGSKSSVHKKFLDSVDADVAVISCGRDNDYGHPHKDALNYVSRNNMILYRTDKDGDIVFGCNSYGFEKVN